MTIRKYYSLFVVLFLTILNASAQITIKGTIKDMDKLPYPMIAITLKSLPDSTIITYNFSDSDGNYQLDYKGSKEKLDISVAGLQIIPQSKIIKNENQTIDFIVKEKDLMLKEVVVKAQKMWGQKDTINYLVSAFSHANDVVIGDVLRRMPGISISENGEISYQGKQINKFYIEDLDLLGGRYSIATNNISAEDIATVQILESHQPIESLLTRH